MTANITRHTDKFGTAPQLSPTDMTEVAALGFKTVVNNRPDGEGADQPSFKEIEAAALQHAEAVIAYGGDDTLNALSLRMPAGVRWLPHGHKLSFGLIAASTLSARHAPELVLAAAQDVARYDQGGCYSPHVFYVQRGGRVSPREWAQRLAAALNNQHARHPRRAPDAAQALSMGQWRQTFEWGQGSVLFKGDGGDVAYSDAPVPLTPGPGLRCVHVVAWDAMDELLSQWVRARPWLQTAGLGKSWSSPKPFRICSPKGTLKASSPGAPIQK